jgi:dethiobiotin synthetase
MDETQVKSPPFPRYVISAIHTGSGKTLLSSLLVAALDAYYWKPVQAGRDPETDAEFVARAAQALPAKILPESYLLHWPASPHAAAEKEGIEILPHNLIPPQPPGPLIIEGAGGLMVPLNRKMVYADVFQSWKLPVVLVINTYLGSINHALLSLEAMKARNIPIHGIVFNDEGRPESEEIIEQLSGVKVLARLPRIEKVDKQSLLAAFHAHFQPADWQ